MHLKVLKNSSTRKIIYYYPANYVVEEKLKFLRYCRIL
jgi:hypothetical protein